MRQRKARLQAIEARLGRETEIWVATVRRDGRPHLVPVWFVYLEGNVYFCTGKETQKWANLLNNQNIALSLPDTNATIIIEGEAHATPHQVTNQLADFFFDKYEWDFRYDDSATWRVVQVIPHKILAWGDGLDEVEGIRVL